jgi:hypothetical protein
MWKVIKRIVFNMYKNEMNSLKFICIMKALFIFYFIFVGWHHRVNGKAGYRCCSFYKLLKSGGDRLASLLLKSGGGKRASLLLKSGGDKLASLLLKSGGDKLASLLQKEARLVETRIVSGNICRDVRPGTTNIQTRLDDAWDKYDAE